MRRIATAVLALALCATFSFADYHHHVDDGQEPDRCSACTLANLGGCAAPQAIVVETSTTDQGLVAETGTPKTCSAATLRLTPRAPPASR